MIKSGTFLKKNQCTYIRLNPFDMKKLYKLQNKHGISFWKYF